MAARKLNSTGKNEPMVSCSKSVMMQAVKFLLSNLLRALSVVSTFTEWSIFSRRGGGQMWKGGLVPNVLYSLCSPSTHTLLMLLLLLLFFSLSHTSQPAGRRNWGLLGLPASCVLRARLHPPVLSLHPSQHVSWGPASLGSG